MFLYLVDYTKRRRKSNVFFAHKNDIYFHEINPNTTGQIKIIEQKKKTENEQQNYSIKKVCNSHQVVHAIFLIHTLNNI